MLNYATRPDPVHAYEVLTDIRAQIERLARYPAYGRSGKKVNTRELIIRRYPYIAVYRVVGEQVVSIRVHHARQQD